MRILLEQAPGAPMDIEFPRCTLYMTIILGLIIIYFKSRKD